MIEVRELCKRYAKIHALRDLSVTFSSGRVTALLGPNGSGKSTLMKSILGLVQPDSGTIQLAGTDTKSSVSLRRSIGYMPQICRFPEFLTPLELFAMLCDVRNSTTSRQSELCEYFDVDVSITKPLRSLSGGTRQRVNAITALMFDAEYLLLDEPTAGLDPLSSSRFKQLIKSEKEKGKTIIISSHIMSEVEEIADDLVFLLDGSLYFSGSKDELLADAQQNSLETFIAGIMQKQREEQRAA